MAARLAQSQVKPRVSDLQAVFTAIAAGRHISNLIGMSALAIHATHHKLGRILLHCACRRNPALRSLSASGVGDPKSSFSGAFPELPATGTRVAQLFSR